MDITEGKGCKAYLGIGHTHRGTGYLERRELHASAARRPLLYTPYTMEPAQAWGVRALRAARLTMLLASSKTSSGDAKPAVPDRGDDAGRSAGDGGSSPTKRIECKGQGRP